MNADQCRENGSGLEARIVIRRPDGFTLDVELEIEPGTTAALLGPNGSGKSTTVDAIAGIQPMDRGRIELGGRVLDDPEAGVHVASEHRHIGVVFQRYLLFEHLDVRDNVAFGLAASGLSRREARRRAGRWVDLLDLGELADRRPSQLSGGQAQRVALARALAPEPDLLLLDEPLAAVDIAARTRLRRTLVGHLDRYPGPRLLITHDPTDAFLLADRIYILEAGRITQTGSPDDIHRRPSTPYVAALTGLNLLSGHNDGGVLTLDEHDHTLRSADTATSGPVLATIPPNAIALHNQEPHGSPRNAWSTTIATVEPLGDITRITLADPLPLSVDITSASAQTMGLAPGSPVWTSIKATEIRLNTA